MASFLRAFMDGYEGQSVPVYHLKSPILSPEMMENDEPSDIN